MVASPAVVTWLRSVSGVMLLMGLFPGAGTSSSAAEPLSFNREIRPILAEHCWKCHGFDLQTRQGGLRLDERGSALAPAESGAIAVVPGRPEDSELIVRLTTADDDRKMPPASEAKRPTAAEIAKLTQWIAEGATYEQHWSFEPLVRPVVPEFKDAFHPVDAFVAERLAAAGLSFAPEADRDTLIRRVYLDLIGLPPTPAELETARRESWEQTIDRLLGSPHFGEHMAVAWLDAARYADTDGYFGDKPRQMWLWRDWVIGAFNRNLPFDQFTIEQIAGDLLPQATIAQQIATGFNRNHMTNDETGLIDEEYRVEYVADRVDTTMATWLGLTIGCAQCHDHKYDPISQREYYQLFAFFNNVPETGLLVGHDAPPRISAPSPAQSERLAELEAATRQAVADYEPLRLAAEQELKSSEAHLLATLPPLLDDALLREPSISIPLDGSVDGRTEARGTPLQSVPGIRANGLKFDATQHVEFNADKFPVDGPWTLGLWLSSEKSLGCVVSKISPSGDRRGIEVLWQKGRIGVHLVHHWGVNAIEVVSHERLAAKAWQHVVIRYDGSKRADGVQLFFNGRRARTEIRRDSLTGAIASEEPVRIGRRDEGLGFYGSLDEFRWLSRAAEDDQIGNWYRGERLLGILDRPAEQRSAQDAEWMFRDHIERRADAATQAANAAVLAARDTEKAVRDAIPLALVMDERADVRPTHVLVRGVYDQLGERVEPGTPAALSPWPPEAPRNRLGLAQWLVTRDNPLVARVAVNRLWTQCFGEGLVRTTNDFGTQGEAPTHPALLDYLAATFRDSGWDTKALLRVIVTSRTYRQHSGLTIHQGNVLDPENRLLARGPRFRLPMEMIRDHSLAISGLLNRQLGGPSVKPYQPPGLWEEVSYDGESTYEMDRGAGRYRRSLYTYLKRQAPPPALLIFDGPTREKCTLSRPRTNTPLQALVLLNDPTFVEAAQQIALDLLSSPASEADRVGRMVRRVLSREVDPGELPIFRRLLTEVRSRYRTAPAAAQRLTSSADHAQEHVELAAWTILAHTLLNLDEAITRR